MISLAKSQFEEFNVNDKVLENSYVYLISRDLKIDTDENTSVVNNDGLRSLCPSEELYKQFKSGAINKKSFKRSYIKQLKTYENKFLIYTIIRAFNEKQFLPIFVCSDEEWETGYLKILTKYINKNFGLSLLKAKKYNKIVKGLWKKSKKAKGKDKRRNKAFRKLLVDYIKDATQLSIEGLELLERLERKFAIDRIAILINQSNDPMEEVSKKSIIKSIEMFAETDKKAAKLVKSAIKELDISRKSSRWSKEKAIRLALCVYKNLHKDIDD